METDIQNGKSGMGADIRKDRSAYTEVTGVVAFHVTVMLHAMLGFAVGDAWANAGEGAEFDGLEAVPDWVVESSFR